MPMQTQQEAMPVIEILIFINLIEIVEICPVHKCTINTDTNAIAVVIIISSVMERR